MQQLLGYVLGLILTGLAAYGAYEAYSSAMDGQHIQSLQTQISSIEQQVTTQYQRRTGRYNFGTIAVATLISSKIVPQSAINGTAVTNPFDGTYSVIGNGNGATSPLSTFSVLADNIPETDCEQIVKSFGTGGGLNGGPIYGYAVTATITGGGTITSVIPDTDTNAKTNCAAPGTETVAIQFVFNG
jgi:hypothetical protein